MITITSKELQEIINPEHTIVRELWLLGYYPEIKANVPMTREPFEAGILAERERIRQLLAKEDN